MRDKGHEVSVYDQNACRTSNAQMLTSLSGIKNVDVVAAGGLVTTYARLKQILPSLRQTFPKARIVLGGGVTVEPEVVFKNMPVDFCVHGEAEQTFAELCDALERNETDFSTIDGISYVENGNLLTTNDRAAPSDLDRLPIPAYDLFPSEVYFKNNVIKNQMGMKVNTERCATLMWSRGCPYRCSFCWRMAGNGVRFRSLKLLFDEIDYLKSNYGVDSYLFVDECINASYEKAKKFANGLIESGNAAPWYSHARVNTFNEEIGHAFKKSGCVGLNFGIESGSAEMLRVMNKKATPAKAAEAVKLAKKLGIEPICTFMIGMPGETKATVAESVRWIRKNSIGKSVFFFATPYPACDLYKTDLVRKRILEKYRTKDGFFSVLGEASELCLNMTDFSDSQLRALKKHTELKVSFLSLHKWLRLLRQPDRWRPALLNLFRRLWALRPGSAECEAGL